MQRDHIHTVHDALSGLSQAQSVQLTQSTRPGVIIEGQQQSLIEVLPPILVLQLKRFGYDTMGVAKVGKQVRFGPELEIGHGMFVNSLSRFFFYNFIFFFLAELMVPAAKKAHPPKYKLFGGMCYFILNATTTAFSLY